METIYLVSWNDDVDDCYRVEGVFATLDEAYQYQNSRVQEPALNSPNIQAYDTTADEAAHWIESDKRWREWQSAVVVDGLAQ